MPSLIFNLLVVYVLITSTIMFVEPSLYFILGSIIAIISVVLLNQNESVKKTDLNAEIEFKLDSLPVKTEYLYLNVNAINFFYNIRDLGEFNKRIYEDSIEAVDNMLHLLSDMRTGVKNCSNTIDIATGLKRLALNNMNSLILLKLEDEVLREKHKTTFKKFHLILIRIIDEMKKICTKQIKKEPLNWSVRYPKDILEYDESDYKNNFFTY